jgi:uncharacterized damage-inducible protein DinB
VTFPAALADETEQLLEWLDYLRGAVMRKATGLDDKGAHWRPDGALISVIGVINHLTHVEWRWIDGGMYGAEVSRSESEFTPEGMTLDAALADYRERAAATTTAARSLPLDAPCLRQEGTNLRWVLLHLINETARHAGHADATRELYDGTTGE